MKKIIFLILLLPVIGYAQIITPIASIQDSLSIYNGQIVTIQGIITVGAGITNTMQMNAFIQDDSGRGIELFDYNIGSSHLADLIRGNELEVTGEVDEYNGVTEIKDFTWTILSVGNPEPTPIYVDLSQYLNYYEGTLVRAVGEITDSWYAGGGTNIIITDNLGFSTTVRVWDSTGLDLSEFIEGYLLEAVGIAGIYNGAFQILPGYQDQLQEGEFDIYPYGDISETLSGIPVQITFYYPGEYDSVTLFWKTNEQVDFEVLEMQPQVVRNVTYETEFPAQSAGTKVEFYITTIDTSDVETTYPIGYPETEAPYNYVIPINKTKAVLNVPPKPFNPYDGETFPIEFASKRGDKAIVQIYNAEGKLIFEPQNIIISTSSGINRYDWNGRDKENKIVPLGLYICYLEIIETASGKKKTAKAPIVVGAPLK